jgi:hypothetical protein
VRLGLTRLCKKDLVLDIIRPVIVLSTSISCISNDSGGIVSSLDREKAVLKVSLPFHTLRL